MGTCCSKEYKPGALDSKEAQLGDPQLDKNTPAEPNEEVAERANKQVSPSSSPGRPPSSDDDLRFTEQAQQIISPKEETNVWDGVDEGIGAVQAAGAVQVRASGAGRGGEGAAGAAKNRERL